VAKQVRDMIVTGDLPGEARLRTEHLAERLGVSATPVREALMSLVGEGMVDFQPGRGFRVVSLTRQDLTDVYDMQAYLSGELAARAASRLTDEDLAGLDKLQDMIVAAVDSGDLAATEQADFEVHRLINRAAGAPKLAWMLSLTLRYVPFSAYANIPGWPLAARDDHVPLLRGLRRRSPQTARDAMRAHIRNAGDLLTELLAEQGVLAED
jgi:DNA-binding GntR family transcriptional regulator